MTGVLFVLLGQLIALAFAAGLNLYSTVALLGLAGRLGWIEALPPELRGLQHPIVIATAAALYLVEFVVDKVPRLDTAWDTLHTVVRPAAAITLTVAALAEAPFLLRVLGGLLAGAVALLAHGTKAGVRLTVLDHSGAAAHVAVSLVEDVVAVLLAVVAFRFPSAAPAMAGVAVAATSPFLPRLSRAFLLGMRGAHARLRGLLLGRHWRDPGEMPRGLRALLDPEVFGQGTPRATRVAVRGLPGVGAFRNGWIVLAGERPVLVYRARFRARTLELPPGGVTLEHRFWSDRALVRTRQLKYAVYFLKDGPAPELALAELTPTATTSP